jgi:transposase
VYGWDTLVLLRHLLDEGLSKTAIAARLGVSRRVVYHWLATGQLDRDLSAVPPPRRAAPRATKLDAYKPLIDERLAAYPELSAVRLLAECQAAGYTGAITQLKAYVGTVRPQPTLEPLVRFETAPGHQAQVDFAEVRSPWGKRFVLLVVLGYSRLLWLRFYPRQTMQTLMLGIEEAFGYFGGVPRELLFDQLKAVVIEDERPGGGKLLENPEFLRFAAHWGFRIRACRPYRAKTKGKVERPVRYLRESFLYGREFLGDGDLDEQRAHWLERVANARVHGTTKEVPRERFQRDEQHMLQPLALRPYRPLVLPDDARRTPRVMPSTHVSVPAISVERRSLAAYTRLAQLSELRSELTGEVA